MTRYKPNVSHFMLTSVAIRKSDLRKLVTTREFKVTLRFVTVVIDLLVLQSFPKIKQNRF